jgi:hypothetical protein
MRSYILTALNITNKFTVFLKVTPHSLVDTNFQKNLLPSSSEYKKWQKIALEREAAGSSEILVDIWFTLSWFSEVSNI